MHYLIKKHFHLINIKDLLKSMIVFNVVFFTGGIRTEPLIALNFLALIYNAVLSSSDFIYDKNPALYNFPVTRKEYVISQALFEIICIFALYVISIIILFAITTAQPSIKFIFSANNIFLSLILCSMYNIFCTFGKKAGAFLVSISFVFMILYGAFKYSIYISNINLIFSSVSIVFFVFSIYALHILLQGLEL